MNLKTDSTTIYPLLITDAMNDTSNSSCDPNSASKIEQYYIMLPILLIASFIAMMVNVVVIASARWIRCSLTPNLKISLSLATADAASSSMGGLVFLIEDYEFKVGVLACLLEILRLSGIVITVAHLLALSLNHYIGILKPLHYNSIVTNKKVSRAIWLLWLAPFLIVTGMCAWFDSDGTLKDNFLTNSDIYPQFMMTFSFRMSYSMLFFLPVFVMMVCYSHIVFVVKKQQTRWDNLSRVGSIRIKGKVAHKMSRERKQLEGNVKAIYTTLLILGSCFLGWTPAILIYTLNCKYGCFNSGEDLANLNCNHLYFVIGLRLVENILIISKMLANPIIYSIRMREIKDGTHRMRLALVRVFCKSRRSRFEKSGFHYRSRLQNSAGGGTIQVTVTSVKNERTERHMEDNTIL
ncbi:adenosine receptor A1-like [Euwallacea similis]|uniref:adenosine receptor A1-like n=1 Tax=Euwallacea similis TaxID=1736056 RepID=UPI00344F771D